MTPRNELSDPGKSPSPHSTELVGDTKKILAIPGALDLNLRIGCTPAWWQLLKAFRELGHEVIAIPYAGDAVESLWWRTYENPCSTESKVMYRLTNSTDDRIAGKSGISKRLSRFVARHHVRRKWRQKLFEILEREGDVDIVLMMTFPFNHLSGIPTELREEFGVQVAYYEGDMPTILPEYAVDRGFRFNYYEDPDIDLGEFDAFFSNSKGAIPEIKKRGARDVYPLYWAVDPQLFKPADVEKKWDVAFYAHGDEMRREWMTNLISTPSRQLSNKKFVVGGHGFTIDLGNVERVGKVPYADYPRFVGSAQVNLNITRTSHTSVYASATTRPFELAALGACIVSQPYSGIEEWFEPGKELEVVSSTEEVIETYEQLLEDPEACLRMGARARERLEREHTYAHRAQQILDALSGREAGS